MPYGEPDNQVADRREKNQCRKKEDEQKGQK